MKSARVRQRIGRGAILCALLITFMLFQSGGVDGAAGKRIVEGLPPSRPAARPCCLLTNKRVFPWTLFPWVDPLFDPLERLDHQYGAGTWSYVRGAEVNGLTYTCSVGFIDLGHVRHVAALTYFYYGRLKEATKPGDQFKTVDHDGLSFSNV
jgi:hypothetical protein